MELQRIGNKLKLGLAGLVVALSAGCTPKTPLFDIKASSPVSINLPAQSEAPAQNAPEVQKEKPNPRYTAFIEQIAESQGDNQTYTTRLKLFDGKDQFGELKVKDTEDNLETIFAARGTLDSQYFKGNGEVVGSFDRKGNWGIGFNGRGNVTESTKLGLALERSFRNGSARNMGLVYGRQTIDDFALMGGLLDNNRDTSGFVIADADFNRNVFAVGASINDKGNGFVAVEAGRYFAKPGEGFGYRLLTKADMQGNVSGELLATTKNTISKTSLYLPMSPEGGYFDPWAVENRFDQAPYFWQRGNELVFKTAFSCMRDGKDKETADLIYCTPAIGEFTPLVGFGVSREDANKPGIDWGVNGYAGVKKGNSYIILEANKTEGRDPLFRATGGLGFDF